MPGRRGEAPSRTMTQLASRVQSSDAITSLSRGGRARDAASVGCADARLSPAMRHTRVGWRLGTIVHTVITNYLRNAQPVVGEHGLSARALNPPVWFDIAPFPNRVLVAPVGERAIFPGQVRLSKRSIEMNPSIRASSGRNAAAASRYASF